MTPKRLAHCVFRTDVLVVLEHLLARRAAGEPDSTLLRRAD